MEESTEKTVPLSLVFISVGGLILIIVGLLSLPALARRGGTAVPLPTWAAAASLPETATATPASDRILLPETPPDAASTNPNLIAAADAPQRPIGAGQPVRLVIPGIDLDAPVGAISLEPFDYQGETYYQWAVPNEFLAGWHDNSARLGEPGNTVLNGHHNVYGEVFRDLIDVERGDELILYDQDGTYRYRVTQKKLMAEQGEPLAVRLQNAQWIEPTTDERVTLITCWPYTGNSHRLVLVAEPVP